MLREQGCGLQAGCAGGWEGALVAGEELFTEVQVGKGRTKKERALVQECFLGKPRSLWAWEVSSWSKS